MENSKKINYFFLIIFLFSCNNKVKNSNYLIFKNGILYFKNKIEVNNYLKNNYSIRNDSVFLSIVNDGEIERKNSDVIDCSTFDLLYNNPTDRKRVDNEFYLKDNDNGCYFKDKNYIYIFSQNYACKDCNIKNPIKFFIAGNSNDYEVLGGGYLRVGNKIYADGNPINKVDVATFRTYKVPLSDSEWETTAAYDKNHYYVGSTIVK